jgi:hypothetical protein
MTDSSDSENRNNTGLCDRFLAENPNNANHQQFKRWYQSTFPGEPLNKGFALLVLINDIEVLIVDTSALLDHPYSNDRNDKVRDNFGAISHLIDELEPYSLDLHNSYYRELCKRNMKLMKRDLDTLFDEYGDWLLKELFKFKDKIISITDSFQ